VSNVIVLWNGTRHISRLIEDDNKDNIYFFFSIFEKQNNPDKTGQKTSFKTIYNLN
jgi:hypothetical protein